MTSAGHYIVVVGWDEATRDFICHDPYGAFDFEKNTYKKVADKVGAYIRYAYEDLFPILEQSSKSASNNKIGGMRFIYSISK